MIGGSVIYSLNKAVLPLIKGKVYGVLASNVIVFENLGNSVLKRVFLVAVQYIRF